MKLPDGGIEILCTSLSKSKKYGTKELGNLYHLRWGIEEGVKLFKKRIQAEAFRAKTAISMNYQIKSTGIFEKMIIDYIK